MQVAEGQFGPTILLLVWIIHGFSQFFPLESITSDIETDRQIETNIG